MSCCDPLYLLVFLPLVMLLYTVFPKRFRPAVLLFADYVFLFSVSGTLSLFLFLTTMLTHYYGIWHDRIENCRKKAAGEPEADKKAIKKLFAAKQKRLLALFAVIHIGILAVLKYSGFALGNINSLLGLLGARFSFSIPSFAMPLGISFYTLQAVSYCVDVYRGKLKAEDDLSKIALYMSFFPILTEGPICRFSETAEALSAGTDIDSEKAFRGYLRILYGVVKKVIVADRLNVFVGAVFDGYEKYDGAVIALGAVMYTCQLYMDFSGVMDIVCGSAEIFGVKLPENFRQPFFSKSVSEFWKRWHITLGAWFRDYIFFPVSMSKPMKKFTVKARKKLGGRFGGSVAAAPALMCVWLANGLWHGSAWNYVFFGVYHFAVIFTGSIAEPYIASLFEKIHVSRDNPAVKALRIVKTSVIVCIGELFFRAETVGQGFRMLAAVFGRFSFASLVDGTVLSLGADGYDFFIVGAVAAFVFIIGILKEKNISVVDKISEKNAVVRYAVLYALVLAAVIFGAYGDAYTPVEPMYAEF